MLLRFSNEYIVVLFEAVGIAVTGASIMALTSTKVPRATVLGAPRGKRPPAHAVPSVVITDAVTPPVLLSQACAGTPSWLVGVPMHYTHGMVEVQQNREPDQIPARGSATAHVKPH